MHRSHEDNVYPKDSRLSIKKTAFILFYASSSNSPHNTMPSSKKPRKAYRPKYVAQPTNMMKFVKESVSAPEPQQLERIQTNFSKLIERFLEAEYPSYEDWDMIRTVLMISQEVEKQGAVRNLQAEIDKIGAVIYDIYDRFCVFHEGSDVPVWTPTPFPQEEKDELFWFKKIYRFQMENLSMGEYTRCIERVERQRASWPKVVKQKD